MADAEFVHVPDRNRFEIHLDGATIGKSYYRDDQQKRTFTHTEVDPEFQGQGLASRLIKVALDTTAEQGLRIDPQCPAVAAYVLKHHDYDELLVS
jgi:uncharacterized protein